MQKRRRTVPKPEEIIGEWGIRDVTPPSAAERERVSGEAEFNPLVGKPLPRRIRRFGVQTHTYLPSLGGPLPYMRRAREIDDETERHRGRLAEAYAEHRDDPEGWRRIAARWDFGDVNELIERHNRWYPVEAQLPMDPRTRDYVKVGGRSYRRNLLDSDWILEQFP